MQEPLETHLWSLGDASVPTTLPPHSRPYATGIWHPIVDGIHIHLNLLFVKKCGIMTVR